MVRRRGEINSETRHGMMNGEGAIRMLHILRQEELGGGGRLFSRVFIDPGSSIGCHAHEKEREIYYVLKGRGAADHDGEPVSLEEGDVMVIGNGMSHGIRNDGEETLELLAVILKD